MTNTEGNDHIDPVDAHVVDLTAAPAEALPEFVETVATMDGHFDRPERAYRTLSWLARGLNGHSARVRLEVYSDERRESVHDLIRNGLVSERVYVAGPRDGERRLKVTELGMERLHAAREVAALAVTA